MTADISDNQIDARGRNVCRLAEAPPTHDGAVLAAAMVKLPSVLDAISIWRALLAASKQTRKRHVLVVY